MEIRWICQKPGTASVQTCTSRVTRCNINGQSHLSCYPFLRSTPFGKRALIDELLIKAAGRINLFEKLT